MWALITMDRRVEATVEYGRELQHLMPSGLELPELVSELGPPCRPACARRPWSAWRAG